MKKVFFLLVFLLSIFVVNAEFDFNLKEQDSGLISALEGGVISLSLDGTNEVNMTLDRVGNERIMTTLNPGNKVIIFDLEQEKELDLNEDGVSDVKITLNNVIDKLANFKISGIDVAEEAAAEDTEGNDTIITSNEGKEENLISSNKNLGKWVLGGAVAVIVLAAFFFVMRSGNDSEKLYEKAMELHREGQEFHWEGDDETAEELYDKAGEFREKARNLGGY